MARRNRRNTKSTLPWWVWVLGIMALWLVGASVWQKSPVHALTDGYRSIIGKKQVYNSPLQQQQALAYLQDSIQTLHTEIVRLKSQSPYRKAMVNTKANSLNLRSESNISSEVVIKIPDSSIVEVLYFDEEALVLEGETGKWCKIKYADKEGWVWGNYVQLLD